MTNDKTVTMPRELLNDLLDSARLEVDERIRSFGEDYRPHVLASLRKMVADAEAILAAPVVERQEVVAYLDERGKFVFIGYDALRSACWVDSDGRAIPDAWQPVYTSPSVPVAVDAAKAFAKGFNTLETIDGKYKIVMQFAGHDDAWEAYTALSKMTACLDKVKEPNQ